MLQTKAISRPYAADQVADMTDRLMFVDMLKDMLHLDAARRVTPTEVLRHDFISMRHLSTMHRLSSQ